ncbi:MAG TPA: SOS response-associated peptidase [Clostridiales bacterium]|nr:SOS response-associated peptidase [Clostridiales bacterium]HQP70178.1 SOS response-associated peptidase [Clostridiales bacterium]
MCGRFAQVYDDAKILNKFRLEDISERIQPKFNMSPGMKVNAVMAEESALKLKKAEWGFSEINGKPLPSLMVNSRLDTLINGSFTGRNLITSRCVIPVSGFYEWKGCQPYYIYDTSDILCLAGVYVRNNESIRISVVTTDSEDFLKDLHHRMPLILSGASLSSWLSSDKDTAEKLDLFKNTFPQTLKFHEVTQAVNSAGYEKDDCIKPLRTNRLF